MGRRTRQPVAQQSVDIANTSWESRFITRIGYVIVICMFVVGLGAIASAILGVQSGTALGAASGFGGTGGLCGIEYYLFRSLRLTILASVSAD